MIEINLIPEKLKKAKQMQLYYVYAGVVVALIMAVALGVLWMQQQKISEIDRKIADIDAKSQALQDKIAMVRQFKAMEETYNKKKELIQKLLRDQSLWTEILDSVGGMLPPDMWLTGLEELKAKDDGVQVQVDGFAFSRSVIADFVKNIERSGTGSEVKIVEMLEEKKKSVDTVRFKLTFMYKMAAPVKAAEQAK